jgi:hypothetical protein
LPGRYLATISFAGGQTPRPWYRDFFTQRPVYEVVAGKRVLATCPLTSKHLRKGRIELKFSVKVEEFVEPDFGAIEVRLWSPGTMEFGIGSVRVSELS